MKNSKFNIASSEETIQKLYEPNVSIARFGDGELSYIEKIGLYFQPYNEELANRLKEILNSNVPNLLIGLPIALNPQNCELYEGFAKEYWVDWLQKNEEKMEKLINPNKKYYSAQISRFYLDYKDKSNVANYVKMLKELWNDRDVVIVEGEKSRLGVGNDLFDNMRTIKRILCPPENAFLKYDSILEEIKKTSKNNLILLALGPTATVLAYDLHKLGYKAIDIGHVDIEYEWYLRKAKTKIKIESKYMGEQGVMGAKAESEEERLNIKDIKDENYEKQIIARITSIN